MNTSASIRRFDRSEGFGFSLDVVSILECITGALFTAGLLFALLPLFAEWRSNPSFMTALVGSSIPLLFPINMFWGILGLILRKFASRKAHAADKAYLNWMLLIGIYNIVLPVALALLEFLLVVTVALPALS